MLDQKHRRRLVLLCATVATPFVANAASAQPLPPADPSAAPAATNQDLRLSRKSAEAVAANGSALGEVVVTARRRQEDVQKVPIAMTVIGGARLEQTQTFTLGQLQTQVPALQVYSLNPRNTNINIRGLGTNLALANDGLESGVGFYLDGVYYGRPGQAQFDLVDLDQIEVLRGPQGTLFGKNTTAGALNITSRSPSFTPEGVAEVSGGNYSYFQARASVSGPIIDNQLAGRLSVSETTRGGFVDNVANGKPYNDYNNVSVRGQLLYRPNNRLKVRVIADYSRQNERCCIELYDGAVTERANGTPIPNNFATRSAAFNYAPPSTDPFDRETDVNARAHVQMKTGGLSVQGDYDFGFATLTSITAYRRWIWDPANDSDYTALPILNVNQVADRQRQASQEFRLTSDGAHVVDWVAGLYFFYQDLRGIGQSQYGTDGGPWLFYAAAVPTAVKVAAANSYTLNTNLDARTSSYAAFAQDTWHISPKLSLTTGIRYTYEGKTGSFVQNATGPNISTLLTGANAAYVPTATALRASLGTPESFYPGLNNDAISGTANLAYQLTPNVLAYGLYSRGEKSGGLNLAALNLVAANPVVQPETVDDYEAGLKTRLFDRRVTVNLAAFWTEDHQYQTNIVSPYPPYVAYLANIPHVRSRGIEWDAQARPVQGVSLYTSGAYDQATLVSFPDAPCGIERLNQTSCDLSGRPIPGVSKWAVSAGGEYDHSLPTPTELTGYFGLDYSYRSSFYSQATDSTYSQIGGYSLVNARIGIRSPGGRWDLQVWSKNLFNQNYFNIIFPGGVGNTGAIFALVGDPRTFGATLRVRL